MGKVKVLLVGIGGYGENYISEFLNADIPNAELAGVADPFIFKSPFKDEIERRNIPVCSSPEEFYLRYGSVDLTVISSPIHTHCGYILSALAHGSNVLTEKPVVISLEKMDELIAAEQKSGCFVAVGYQLCFSPDVLQLKKDILSGMYGRPVRMRSLRIMRRGDKYYARNGWAGKLSCHGEYVFDSPLSNACAHQLQNMLYLLGSEMEASADVSSLEGLLYKGRPSIENFDAAALKVKTDGGIDLYYYTAHAADEKKLGPISTFEFEKGVITEDSNSFVGTMNDGLEIDYSRVEKGKKMQKLYDSINCVSSGCRPYCTLASSKAHVKAVLMAEDLPVYLRYDAVRKMDEDGDYYYSIPGLSQMFLDSYRNWKLPQRI